VQIINDIDDLLSVVPVEISSAIPSRDNLIEIVLDLGRLPEARFFENKTEYLSDNLVTQDQIDCIVNRISDFGGDNRSGIEKTLHRISCIRNRRGKIIGLTMRVGRAVFGSVDILLDIVNSGKSILILGGPGQGKTTKLREISRILSESKRVIIVDTSNEIAGDGDIPHPATGKARRLQVKDPKHQFQVMIESVENHFPQVLVIDEISTEQETLAARTIAERGVVLIGTAHGKTLDNLILNPTLSDLLGGITSCTLSDEEANRRGCQKTILERKQNPTFDIIVEIMDYNSLAIHFNVAEAVDCWLKGGTPKPEIRTVDSDGNIVVSQKYAQPSVPQVKPQVEKFNEKILPRTLQDPVNSGTIKLYSYCITRSRLEHAAQTLGLRVKIVRDVEEADYVLVYKKSSSKNPECVDFAKSLKKKVYFLQTNTYIGVEKLFKDTLL
jgi:stage III sporulation protein SpoIIIAA